MAGGAPGVGVGSAGDVNPAVGERGRGGAVAVVGAVVVAGGSMGFRRDVGGGCCILSAKVMDTTSAW